VREASENVGKVIVDAMAGIERANPDTLFGVFSGFDDANWTDKGKLSDERLKDLVEHMSKIKVGNANYSADVMGEAYEYLIKKFADLSKKNAGEFYTPRPIVKLLVMLLAPKAGETVYDPACGTGGMLIEAIRYMHDDKQTYGKIYGQEKNLSTSAIARMNLFLHGVLFRTEESSLREKLIRTDLVECVIGLGANLFYNSPMEACIVICRTSKTAARRGQILLINAVGEVTRKNAYSYLEDAHIKKIANAYEKYADIDGFSKVVTIADAESNNFSLSIPLYVREVVDEESMDTRSVDECVTAWLDSAFEMRTAFEDLKSHLGGGATVYTFEPPELLMVAEKAKPDEIHIAANGGDVDEN
jgi:type I restriction-modification system DNA methylase subunit